MPPASPFIVDMDLKGALFEAQETPSTKEDNSLSQPTHTINSSLHDTHQPTRVTSGTFSFRAVSLPAAIALFIALLCTVSSVIILGVSDGQAVSSWKVTPTVLLAVSSTIANTAVAVLLSEGISISWWRKFFRGATVAELDQTWSVGYNIQRAAPSLRKLDKTVVATLFAILILLDGPFLQRASTIESRTTQTTVKLHLGIAEQYPPGFTGSQADVNGTINANPEYLIVLQRNQLGRDITDARLLSTNSSCKGVCYGTVRAAGVVPDCEIHSYDVDFTNTTTTSPGLAFSITYSRNQTSPPFIQISILSTRMQHGCTGRVLRQECKLRGATISYSVKIQNASITLLPINDRDPTYYNGGDSNTTLGAGSGPIGGIGVMLEAFYLSNATIYQDDTGDPSVPYVTYENGAQALEYMDFTPIDTNSTYNTSEPLTCQLSSWNDPTHDLLAAIDQVMFRGALLVSETKGTSLATLSGFPDYLPVPYAPPFDATQEFTQLVFSSSRLYMAVSATLMFVCIFGTAVSSWGFWQLDHAVTLSPFETARALGAPGFDVVRPGAELQEIVRTLSNMEVGPGCVSREDSLKV